MNIDWGEDSISREVLPEGTYRVRIKNMEYKSASTGTEQLRVKVTILEPAEYEGKSLVDHIAISEKALWKIKRFVAGCNINLKELPQKMEVKSQLFNKVLDLCKGTTSYWHVIQDSYNGNLTNKVDDYKIDNDQEQISGNIVDDLPEFLKDDDDKDLE